MADSRRGLPELERIRREAAAPRRERLRIVIASDASRPIRTFTLPRGLPRAVSIVAVVLILTTTVLIAGCGYVGTALGVRLAAGGHVVHGLRRDPSGLPPEIRPSGRPDWRRARAQAPSGAVGRFVVESANTGETLEVAVNLATGEVQADSYRRFRHLMRCLRTGAETPVDPRLIDLLYRIAQRTHQKIVLVSGFRAPMFSLATLSYHTRGMAADIRIPGMTPLMVRDLAESMGVGGIGYYPVSGFVHVDVREDHARWIDYGRNRQDGEGAEHGPEHGEASALPPGDGLGPG
jgi:uncharacterized protein YcbK (DUF882 family)